jgi:diketogulonate reductase-like aldo/keto reductase
MEVYSESSDSQNSPLHTMLIICLTSSITQSPGGPVDAVVNAAARRIGATANQVIFSWVRSKGVTIVTYVYLRCR